MDLARPTTLHGMLAPERRISERVVSIYGLVLLFLGMVMLYEWMVLLLPEKTVIIRRFIKMVGAVELLESIGHLM